MIASDWCEFEADIFEGLADAVADGPEQDRLRASACSLRRRAMRPDLDAESQAVGPGSTGPKAD
jgi:hypothetical protein